MMSTCGAFISGRRHGSSSSYNFFESRKSGEIAGNDPWGAPTLEWSIPSPPPEYNFATIPTVTSRYPLWDVKSPELTADVPHTQAWRRAHRRDDRRQARRRVPRSHERRHAARRRRIRTPMQRRRRSRSRRPRSSASRCRIRRSSRCSSRSFMTLMFAGLLFIHKDKMPLAIARHRRARVVDDGVALRLAAHAARARRITRAPTAPLPVTSRLTTAASARTSPRTAHPPTSTGLDIRKIAIWAFIGSECMLFASLISTYLIYKGRSVVGPFPHEACDPPICATHAQARSSTSRSRRPRRSCC